MCSWHRGWKTAAMTKDMLMAWHLLGLLKGDMELARQPLITEGLVLGGGECEYRVSDAIETALSCTINR